MRSEGETSFFHGDRLGSVNDVTSESGKPLSAYAYEPFGATRSERQSPGAPTNPRGFTGEYREQGTGLYDLRARSYDPSSGRFSQPDPAAPLAEQPFVTAYAYANGRPTVMVDPSGRIAFLAPIAIGAAVGTVVSTASYGIDVATSDREWDWGDAGLSAASGAATGAVGGGAGAVIKSLAPRAAQTAAGLAGAGAAGGGGTYLDSAIRGTPTPSAGRVAFSAGAGVFSAGLAGRLVPPAAGSGASGSATRTGGAAATGNAVDEPLSRQAQRGAVGGAASLPPSVLGGRIFAPPEGAPGAGDPAGLGSHRPK